MSDRVVRVRLLAQVSEYEAGMLKAAQATRTVGTEAEKLEQKKQAFESVGRGLVVTGAALAGVTALSIKAAMGWESAWAGVTKTVEGTPEELAKVEDGLRSLTGVLPASHDEIAAVAEAAGQLGIQTGNVVAFTRTMIDLGETTNLSANDAATSLARFVNIMGTSQSQVSNLGSALVGLGNNYATTEAEIMEMSMRLAGAGKQIGMSEGQVLGLATALSSVGIEAEAGGSAMSKVMIDIASSVESGGEKLEKFASTAGMTSEQFSKLWKADSAAALSAFVKGLANAESQGQSTLGVLADLGITEVRMRDALLRSSAAADNFSAAMAMGNSEFEKNNALTEEAAKRYETVESKLRIAGNSIRDAAIDFGEVFLPAVSEAAEGVADFATFMGDLPDDVQGIIGVLTGTAGVLALAGGAALLAVPKFAQFKIAMEVLTGSAFTARGALMSMWRFLIGPWGLAIAAAATSYMLFQKAIADGVPEQAEITNALKTSADAADGFAAAFERGTPETNLWGDYADQLKDLPHLLDRASEAGWRWAELTFNEQGALDSINRYGDALASIASEDLPKAQMAFRGLRDEYGLTEDQTRQLVEEMPAYRDALLKVADDQGIAKDSAEFLQLALGELPGSTAEVESAMAEMQAESDKARDALDGVTQALDDVAGASMAMGDAKDRALASLNALTSAAETEGSALDGTNDASIRLRDSLRDVETAHRDSAEAIINNGGTLADAQAEWQKGRDAVIEMIAAKTGDREEAIRWADQQMGSAAQVKGSIDEVYRAWLNLPENKQTKYEVEKAQAEAALDALKAKLSNMPTYKRITLEAFRVGNFDVSIPGSENNAAGGYYSGGVKKFASGGYEPGIYGYQRGGIHKFAEEYDEAYISMDPARRQQSERVFVQAGLRMGFLGSGGGGSAPSADQIGSAVAQAISRGLRGVANRPVIVAIDGQAIASAVNNENQWG